MIRRSLFCLKRCFNKSKQINIQDHKLSDSYQLSQTEIAEILKRPLTVQSSAQVQQTQNKQLTYGLPKKNQPFPLVYDQEDLREIVQTPTQNLYQVLNIHKSSTFNQYISAIKKQYHHQVDLYGDSTETKSINVSTLQFKNLITTNSPYLLFLRQKYLVNPNIPGTIELQDANNFLDLRPVEQFRHTPLIPIAESTMKKFKQEMDERHSKAFYLSVKTETVLNVGLFILSLVVIGTLMSQVRKGSDKKALEVMRTKHQRMMGDI